MTTIFQTKKRVGQAAGSDAGREEQRKRAKEQAKHAKHHKRKHKPKKHKHRKPVHRSVAHGTIGIALPVASASPPAPSPAPPPSIGSPPITLAQAHRLLWRAGFGPTPGQAEALGGQPLEQVVFGLTRPSGAATLTGPEPVDEEGNPLDPDDAWGEDHCWWLDRMVRSDQQLVERMTFIFHDWFANSNEKVNSQQMMLEQNELFRAMALGSFHDLFLAVTAEPGDARVPRRDLQRQERTERELRARDDGAVLARRRPRRLHRGRRARNGPRADRLAAEWSRRKGCTNSTSTPPATTTTKRPCSARPATGTRKTPCACASTTRCTPRSSSPSCGATSSPARPTKPRSPRCRGCT